MKLFITLTSPSNFVVPLICNILCGESVPMPTLFALVSLPDIIVFPFFSIDILDVPLRISKLPSSLRALICELDVVDEELPPKYNIVSDVPSSELAIFKSPCTCSFCFGSFVPIPTLLLVPVIEVFPSFSIDI